MENTSEIERDAWLKKDPKNSWFHESTNSNESKHELPGLDDDLQALDILDHKEFRYFIDNSSGGYMIYNTKTGQEDYVRTLEPALMKILKASGRVSGIPNSVITSLKTAKTQFLSQKKLLV